SANEGCPGLLTVAFPNRKRTLVTHLETTRTRVHPQRMRAGSGTPRPPALQASGRACDRRRRFLARFDAQRTPAAPDNLASRRLHVIDLTRIPGCRRTT